MLAAAKERGGRALIFVIVVTAIDINNVGIITIDIGINFNKGASTCISHAGADVTSPPRRFRKDLYHEIREAGRARASAEGSHPPQSRAAIGPFDYEFKSGTARVTMVKLGPGMRSIGDYGGGDSRTS